MTKLELNTINITLKGLKIHYAQGDFTPRDLLTALREKSAVITDNPIWIHLLSEQELNNYLNTLEQKDPAQCPLYGVPFAIKDNIDLAGIPTTAACEAFRYTPDKSATVIELLLNAGAIPLGKTNMDQFATGLVGTRSPQPWGPCKNAFDPTIISGGSSSGSAIALAKGLVSFSLGTDTAGSGRVPASLNNVVGLKASKGLISTHGVVPACRSLDCVSIFALNTDDANSIFDVAAQYDTNDDFSRKNTFANSSRYYRDYHHKTGCDKNPTTTVIGIPSASDLEFFGNNEGQEKFQQLCKNLTQNGFTLQEINFKPFINAAKLLYQGPWVAERWLATQALITEQPEKMLPAISTIIKGGESPTAADGFSAQYQLQALKQLADAELAELDGIITPTNPCYFSIKEVEQNPIELNSQLGYYTNFMNLLDYSAVALPADFYTNGVGFGVTLFGPAFTDKTLLSIGARIQNILTLPLGSFKQPFSPQGQQVVSSTPSSTIDVVVCGAHLKGLPLNWQLVERGATFIEANTTTENYHFYALAGGPIKRPALVRSKAKGHTVKVEVWRMPAENFGSFVAEIPAPLGIGKVELADGRWLSGFMCDDWGLEGADDISALGCWKAYLASNNS